MILPLKNPEFKIFDEYNILHFEFPDFKITAGLKILAFQTPKFKIFLFFSSWLSKILRSKFSLTSRF